ncbi:helix-turn-helix domain-containing protein [Flavobacterium sp. NKUCC04_CG]|uniref:helix-turn-helix domain-containing protein n=1 Tax=Flavobacterium sp. NKUCC04_CG TaxID=2842121 RepID=UPI001C5ABB49|nr:helix-turn-helix transcriptional regulator [Flavobacterium sp. NKUCC04_CG]MBW3518335.1 helix-turn-helix domain-containing protein [Flavobacterium sp. NKUCC04_CG]
MSQSKIHQGRNIKRFREMLGIKQEALAFELGEEWNQKKISVLEQKQDIEVGILRQVSEILKIPVEAIENFDEESAINIISNIFHDNSAAISNYPTFHPVDKIIEIHEQKIALYERMLQEKDAMMQKLEQLIERNK